MTHILKSLNRAQQTSYILMEYIQPIHQPAWLVVDGNSEYAECVSEIGRYGILLADQGQVIRNEDCGYLVRTKSADVNEGGVCAGYSCLNTLILEE